ncbi:MAG TPA: cysteine hydrolase [Candidatus Desulfofervidus auxilii]|uniref:Cysteine hydrolase n=1 Tax=Desulfofervidus auxilii TaxID=1621989 RepID=A0A7C0U247_DESA2|nr:cysteine hydrolase [Candidatus Desulfofervidus auxilii]
MNKEAVLVIDMVNDFIDPKGALFCGEKVRKIIPYIKELIENKRKAGIPIIYLIDQHDPDDKEFKRFPPHCIKGTKGAEVISELAPQKGDYIIPKKRFSGFFNTELEEILKKEKITSVHVVGVCTSICVMETVSDLCDRDYEVYIHVKGVADFDEKAHSFALERMKKIFGAKIV